MNHKGFTLVEILVCCLLVSLIGVGISGILMNADKINDRETSLLQLQQQVRLALNSITRELRGANPSTINITGGGSKINFTTNGQNIAYYQNATTNATTNITLNQVIRNNSTLKVLGNYINFLNFSSSGSLVTIQVRATKNVRTGVVSFPDNAIAPLTAKVNLRNG